MSESDTPASSSPPAEPAPPAAPAAPSDAPASAPAAGEAPVSEPAAQQPAPAAAAGNEIDDYEPLTPEIVEEEAIRGDFVLRWAVVLLALLMGSTRIAETGILVHIKTGQYLASHGILPPAHDVFSYTAQDRPWTNLSWGFDLLTALVHALGSFRGISILKAVLMALAFWLIGRISRVNLPTWWGSICGAAALLVCQPRILAEPSLITLVGLALLLGLWFRWRETPEVSKTLWLAVPLIAIWSNLDTGAYLGWGFLVLYAVGDGLAAFLQSPGALAAPARKTLWMVTGAAALATMLHPFGWKSLAAPYQVYGVTYPALRDYITERFISSDMPELPVARSVLAYFPMTHEAFWTGLDLPGIAALSLFVAALGALFLNRRRLDWGQVAVLAGFAGAAVLCLHELPAAALVLAVLATINGQAWYAAACRQTYSIETGELVFSRGGRALTVLTLAGVAFFSGTGRLPRGLTVRTGYGLAHDLELQLSDLEKQLGGDASYDHRPFNTYLTQGDQMLWIGEQVFADSRVAVYFSPNEEENLLRQQLLVRDALRGRRDSSGFAGGTRRSVWSKTLNAFDVTHVVTRMLSVGDYAAFSELLQDTVNWEWTGLGATSAVFYRRDLKDPELKEFVAAHRLDFRKRAFRENWVFRTPGSPEGSEEGITARDRSIRPPSFYQRYFWATRYDSPAPIHEALHLARLASFPVLPPSLDGGRDQPSARPAMALLAIRLAQEGLNSDPDAVDGYLVLGMAYDLLSQIEAGLSTGGRHPRSGLRYIQAVTAYNQVLVGEPDNVAAHLALRKLYHEAGKPDLELMHLTALEALSESAGDEEGSLALGKQMQILQSSLEETDNEITRHSGTETDPLMIAGAYYQRGCVLRALRELERDGGKAAQSARGEELRVNLLLEAGRVDDAFEAGRRFAQGAKASGVRGWADVAALSSLLNADYYSAMSYWQEAADEADLRAFSTVVQSLAPHPVVQPWPISTSSSAFEYLFERPKIVASLKMSAALLYIEQGQISQADHALHEVLATDPDTSDRRLVGYYLREISGGKEEIDLVPASDRVVELFMPEEEDDQTQE